ncbi:MAG: nucleotide exchange factor GrpE [Phycisphaerales bacterium]|nr:MAG: nucleotide exchange factor GrpE [Phycisphaerales bacterium]
MSKRRNTASEEKSRRYGGDAAGVGVAPPGDGDVDSLPVSASHELTPADPQPQEPADRRQAADEEVAGERAASPATDLSDDAGGATAETGPAAEAEQAAETAEVPTAPTIESLQAQIAELNDRLLRARAEVSNVQRRAAAERADAIRFAKIDVVSPLLGVIDDFERSLATSVAGEEAANLLTGVRLVYEKLLKALRDQGIEPIEAAGKPFDPNYHDAMLRQPTDEMPPGRVMQEITRGYRLHDRVIRPARVIVSAAPSGPAADGEGEQTTEE